MAGDLRPDSLLVSVLNRGGNKLDWYLPVDARIATAAVSGGTDVTVHLTVRNTTPRGLPRYVTGPPSGQRWSAGTYVGLVTVDVPGAATEVRIAGTIPPVQGRDGSAQVISTIVELAPGQQREIDLQFHLPGRHGQLTVEPSARMPGITWHASMCLCPKAPCPAITTFMLEQPYEPARPRPVPFGGDG